MENDTFNKLFEILEDKLDAFLDKGLELSKNVSKKDREIITMNLIYELVDKAIQNVKDSGEKISEEEITKRKKEVIEFIMKRYKRKISDIIAGLTHLPRKFNSLGNVSIYTLLKETGYFEKHDQVFEESIHEALTQQPECVDEWISYSEDKRSSTGWYLKQENGETFIVGYIAWKDDKNIELRFADRIVACAAFIKREAEAIRHSE